MAKKKKGPNRPKSSNGQWEYTGDSKDEEFSDILERKPGKPVAKEDEENPLRRTPYFN